MHKHFDILGEVITPEAEADHRLFRPGAGEPLQGHWPHADRQAGPERRELRADLR